MILKVCEDGEGKRIDVWLRDQVQNLSRAAAARLCEEGNITVNG